jgi:hypothetical protein
VSLGLSCRTAIIAQVHRNAHFAGSKTRRADFHPEGSTNSPDIEKAAYDERVEQVHTNERVPGHTNYYEKNGLRTYGDGEDHDHEPPMSFRRAMSLLAMAFRESLVTPSLRSMC